MLVGGKNRMFHILLPWFIESPHPEELSCSCLIAAHLKVIPTRKGKDTCFLYLWCVTWSVTLHPGTPLVFFKCELNFLTQISSSCNCTRTVTATAEVPAGPTVCATPQFCWKSSLWQHDKTAQMPLGKHIPCRNLWHRTPGKSTQGIPLLTSNADSWSDH